MRTDLVIATLALLLAAVACSSSESAIAGPDASAALDAESADAAAMDDAADAEPDFGERCNGLTQQGTRIQATGSTAKVPAPTGGDVPDGIYVIVSTTLRGPGIGDGPVAGTFSPATTVQIRGKTYSDIVTTSSGDVRTSGSVLVSGTSTSFTSTCAYPKPASGNGPVMQSGSYSRTTSGFIVYAEANGTMIEQAYGKK